MRRLRNKCAQITTVRTSVILSIIGTVMLLDLIFLVFGIPVLLNYEDHFTSQDHPLYAFSTMTSAERLAFSGYILLWVIHLAGFLYLAFRFWKCMQRTA